MATDPKFVNTDNTKNRPDGVYGSVISQIQKDGVCPFCTEQLLKYHKNPILKETKYWVATANMYPYKGAKHHILLIHREHITNPSEMSAEAWAELQTIANDMTRESSIPGGTLFMRFGDTKYTGASVTHLHAHIVSSDPTNPDYTPLLARVG